MGDMADTAAAGGESPAEALAGMAGEEPADLEGHGEEGGDDSEAQTEAPAETYTIKVNGEEKTVTLDDLRTMAQKGAGAEKRFEEAAQLRKQLESEMEQVRSRLEGDPVLSAYLSGGREALYAAIEAELEHAALPAEEKVARQRQRDLEAKAAKADEYEKAEQERREAEAAQRAQQHYTAKITEALTGVGVGPKPAAIRRMATLMDTAIEEGARVTIAQLAEQVRDEMRGDLTEWMPSEADQLAELLGEGRVKVLLARETARLKSRSAGVQRTPGSPKKARHGDSGPRVVKSDFWKNPLG